MPVSSILVQNDSPDGTRKADSNTTTQQQQLEQFRYENDKLKIALAQRFCYLFSRRCFIRILSCLFI